MRSREFFFFFIGENKKKKISDFTVKGLSDCRGRVPPPEEQEHEDEFYHVFYLDSNGGWQYSKVRVKLLRKIRDLSFPRKRKKEEKKNEKNEKIEKNSKN